MFKAIVASLLAVILALAVSTFVLWGQGQHKASKIAQAESDLKSEQAVNAELRTSLKVAEESSLKLSEQLKTEREAFQTYQAKTKVLNDRLLDQQEKLRILEREDQTFRDWGNDVLPISIIGLLNKAGTTTSDYNSD